MSISKFDMVTILGPTASGKTGLASRVALQLGGEVISADSRQIYRGMDLGTGKDIKEYTINGVEIPYHLIDIAEAGYQYNVFEFQRDFLKVYHNLKERNILPVMCGGSGLYLESVLKGYKLIQVPVNEERRKELDALSLEELKQILESYKSLHNSSDVENKKRAVRAIEIEEYCDANPGLNLSFPKIKSLIVGVKFDRYSRRNRITTRLQQRLDEGMIGEVEKLLNSGLKPEDLTYYGLEYKYLTLYLTGQLKYDEMFAGLNTAIHQFAKRQMTWFRKMERDGIDIRWLDGYMPVEEKVDKIIHWLSL